MVLLENDDIWKDIPQLTSVWMSHNDNIEIDENNKKIKLLSKTTNDIYQTKLLANKVKILFDRNTLEFKGWETIDAYSNIVIFEINDLKINNQIIDSFFKIPREEDL